VAQHVTIVGGGLAGMVAALRLLQRGYEVTIYEATNRLGGKAGANQTDREFDEHGWHLFPVWYLNIWELVEELGIRSSFVDRFRYAYMAEGQYPRLAYLDTPFAFRTILHNTFHGILPPEYSILYLYTLIDLLSQPVRRRAQLDQVTINGFARSRFYTTEFVVDQLEDTVSRASAIESYEISAMTVRNITRYWLKYNDPWFRILDTNLQSGLIAPIQRAIQVAGAKIHMSTRVTAVNVGGNRIKNIVVQGSNNSPTEVGVETLLLSVPVESLRSILPFDVIEQAPNLGGIFYLRSRAMASMTIYFKTKIWAIPTDHVNFIGSPYDLAMIDVTDLWGAERTVLCIVASDFTPLVSASPKVAEEKLLADLGRYLPFIRMENIERVNLQPHVQQPLFMNTAGAWPRRPKATTEIGNLFIAGDFCQTPIDATCMEGAVTSGLFAAEAIRSKDSLGEPIRILTPNVYPRILFVLLKLLLFPVAIAALIFHFLKKRSSSLELSLATQRVSKSKHSVESLREH